MVAAVCRRHGGVITEISDALAMSLRAAGVPADVITKDEPLPKAYDLVVLIGQGPEFGPLGWLSGRSNAARPFVALWGLDPLPPPGLPARTVRRQLRSAGTRSRWLGTSSGRFVARSLVPRRAKRALRRVVAGPAPFSVPSVETEIVGLDASAFHRLHWIKEQTTLGNLDLVVGTNSAVVETLADVGIGALQLPVGHHPSMGENQHRERDIDVLFLGTTGPARPRRVERLGQLRVELAESGVDLTVTDRPVFGAERAALLNRSKVLVNLRSNSWHPELVRFMLAAACGTAVVSDLPVTHSEPFVAGRHFVAAASEQLAQSVTHLVRCDSDRRALTAAASNLVHTELTMGHVVQEFLHSAEA